jgi:predicted membrane protein
MSPASYLTAPPRVAARSIARLARGHESANVTCEQAFQGDHSAIEPPIEFRDVTIMRLVGEIQIDVGRIRRILEDEDGEEEEAPEDDA